MGSALRGFLSRSPACWVPCGLHVGFSRSPMQCKVDSSRAPGGFRCCAMRFWVLRWAARWGRLRVAAIPTKKNCGARATTSKRDRGAQGLRVLGGPKLIAPTVTHIERKLAPTISPVSATLAILVAEKLDATCCLPTNLALVDDPTMGFEIRSKYWFCRQSLPSKHAVTVGFKRYWWNPLSETHEAIYRRKTVTRPQQGPDKVPTICQRKR